MDPLRILFITSGLGAGGAENHLLSLCRYLSRAGHELAVCTLDRAEGGLEADFIGEGVSLFRLPLGSLRRIVSPQFISGLKRVLSASRPDIIHAHLFHAEMVAGAASFLWPAPVLTTRHSAGLEFHGARSLVARALSPRFAGCIAVSDEAAREAAATGFPLRLVKVLPNAVDPDRFRPVSTQERERRRRALAASLFPGDPLPDLFLVGSAGGLKAVKNFPLLARVAARLIRPSGGPGAAAIRFVIFGKGPERQPLEELVRGLGIEARFSLPGHRSDLEEIYPLFDVFVLTSWREGVPLALLEAMSSGVASVASAVGGIPGVLAEAGVLVRAGDEEGFADAIRRLAEEDGTRLELGRLARVRVLERYSVEIWGERIMEIYRTAMRGRPGGVNGPRAQNN